MLKTTIVGLIHWLIICGTYIAFGFEAAVLSALIMIATYTVMLFDKK